MSASGMLESSMRHVPCLQRVCRLHDPSAFKVKSQQSLILMHCWAACQNLAEGTTLAGSGATASTTLWQPPQSRTEADVLLLHPQELTEGTSLAGMATKASTTPVTSTGEPSVRLRRSQVTVRRSWYSVPSTTCEDTFRWGQAR